MYYYKGMVLGSLFYSLERIGVMYKEKSLIMS